MRSYLSSVFNTLRRLTTLRHNSDTRKVHFTEQGAFRGAKKPGLSTGRSGGLGRYLLGPSEVSMWSMIADNSSYMVFSLPILSSCSFTAAWNAPWCT